MSRRPSVLGTLTFLWVRKGGSSLEHLTSLRFKGTWCSVLFFLDCSVKRRGNQRELCGPPLNSTTGNAVSGKEVSYLEPYSQLNI